MDFNKRKTDLAFMFGALLMALVLVVINNIAAHQISAELFNKMIEQCSEVCGPMNTRHYYFNQSLDRYKCECKNGAKSKTYIFWRTK